LAKQFGVSEQALEGLKDPERHPFPADQKAALQFADAMTEGSTAVPDELFREMRRHFSEPQIVEIATVIGVFNYFNRFNNALHTEITLMDPDVLVQRMAATILANPDPVEMCARVAEMLRQGRRYARVDITSRTVDVGASKRSDADQATGKILRVPIRTGGTAVGAIEVESDRPDAFGEEDRSIVERLAALLEGPLSRPPG
jgi:GAF domain-containing protein